jgi:hypothetical protein
MILFFSFGISSSLAFVSSLLNPVPNRNVRLLLIKAIDTPWDAFRKDKLEKYYYDCASDNKCTLKKTSLLL